MLEDVLGCLTLGHQQNRTEQPLRIIHVITGDAVNTNENAARRVLRYMLTHSDVQYFMIVIKCGSHQSNLVVMTAVCGGKFNKPSEQCGVAGTCVRFFKYLMPAYSEEFGLSLWSYLDRELQLVPLSEQTPDSIERMRSMVELYGESVIPADVAQLCNCQLGDLKHACATGADRADICRRFFAILRRRILVLEERPTVTRFWLFTACVNILLLLLLLRIDSRQALHLNRVNPQKQNEKRLERFYKFMESPDTGGILRARALCLRLTMHATSLTAQNANVVEGRLPT